MKRILFVDDETRVLEGLQRTFRNQRRHWEMSFASGGEEALRRLDETPFDVIVTDMRMPGMDGASLLEIVRERFPGIIRIVLSGYFDTGTALRAVPLAHQFLVKPCDPRRLQSMIERLCGYQDVLEDEATRRMVNAIGNLPALPRTSAALRKAVENPDTPLEHIAAIVEQDVAITAKVMQLVNSALFGTGREVSTVSHAVRCLGIDLLRQLVLSVEIFQAFRGIPSIAGFSLDALENHARSVARIVSLLPLPNPLRSSAVMAALLHDTGKLILASRLPQEFARAIERSVRANEPLHVVERDLFGTTHAEVGAYLLGLWGLPDNVVEAVRYHHCPGSQGTAGEGLNLVAAIHVADALDYDVFPEARAGPGPPNCELNFDYLNSLGISGDIPRWRSLACGRGEGDSIRNSMSPRPDGAGLKDGDCQH